MAEGAWIMNEEGELVLGAEYVQHRDNAIREGRIQWVHGICAYLAEHSSYTVEEVEDAFCTRLETRDYDLMDIFDEFVVETLEGNL